MNETLIYFAISLLALNTLIPSSCLFVEVNLKHFGMVGGFSFIVLLLSSRSLRGFFSLESIKESNAARYCAIRRAGHWKTSLSPKTFNEKLSRMLVKKYEQLMQTGCDFVRTSKEFYYISCSTEHTPVYIEVCIESSQTNCNYIMMYCYPLSTLETHTRKISYRIYICVFMCVHIYIYTYTNNIYIYICVCVCVCVPSYFFINLCIYIYVCMYVCMYVLLTNY